MQMATDPWKQIVASYYRVPQVSCRCNENVVGSDLVVVHVTNIGQPLVGSKGLEIYDISNYPSQAEAIYKIKLRQGKKQNYVRVDKNILA